MTPLRLYGSDTSEISGNRKKGPMLAMPAMLCSPAAVAAEQVAEAVPTGKVEAAAKEKEDIGDSKDGKVNVPTRMALARQRLPVAMATALKPPQVVPLR